MTRVVVTPRARRDVDDAIATLELPADTWARVVRSLRVLDSFPLAGPELEGRWAPTRFVLGPWSWMILLYRFDAAADELFVLAMHDARSATSARAAGR